MFQAVVAGAMALVALYIALRFIFPLPLPLALKLFLALICFAAAERLFLVRLVMGPAGTWDMSREMLIFTGFAHFFVIVLALLTLGRDLLLGVASVIRRQGGFTWPDAAAVASAPLPATGLFCAAVLLTGWGLWQALKVPEAREVRVAVSRLPPALEGLRIAQLSDLHVSETFSRDWLREVVDRTNALQPDLVVITGDLTDGVPRRLAPFVAPLGDLKARYGVFVVPGNHDYFGAFQPWMRVFRNLGLHVLLNEHEVIPVKGSSLVLAGITDPTAARVGEAGPDASQALLGAPQGAFRLLLAHRPAGADKSRAAGADLQLSGHTHGGQILPLQPLLARFNRGYVKGLYNVNGMTLYVHPGSGLWAGAPLRLGVPSEIALLILEPAPKSTSPTPADRKTGSGA